MAERALQPRSEGKDLKGKTSMMSQMNRKNVHLTLFLLTGMPVFVGCISLDSPDMRWAMSQTVLLPATTSIQLSSAASAYYRCHQKWPVSVHELRSLDCADVEKRQQISNSLSGIQWEAMTNVAFKTVPDGKLEISMTFLGGSRTATTNGTSVTWNGTGVTDVKATVDIPKPDTNTVSVESLIINDAEASVTLDTPKPASNIVSTNSR
jgi:hypothetical protein